MGAVEFSELSEEEYQLMERLHKAINQAIRQFLVDQNMKAIPGRMVAGLHAVMAGQCASKCDDLRAEEAACFVLVNAMTGFGRDDIARTVAEEYNATHSDRRAIEPEPEVLGAMEDDIRRRLNEFFQEACKPHNGKYDA